MFAGVDPGQAGARLLPERIPLRFFGSAVLFHAAAWVALAIAAPELPGFAGGPGPVLAAVHLFTLGVLLMTAMGVTFQMLPVAFGRPAPSAGACTATFWLLLAGTVTLTAGFGLYEARLMQAGGVLAAAAVLVYAATVARIVAGTRTLPIVVAAVVIALVAIVLAVGLALAVLGGIGGYLLPDHARTVLAHAVLAAFGFMGMLAIGLSDVVIPLFAMAFVADRLWSRAAVGLAASALLLAVAGLVAASDAAVVAGLVAGLAAVGCHLRDMTTVLAQRMRQRLGGEFVLIRVSWALLPLPILLAAAMLAGWLPETGPALFGFALLYGWLGTLLFGVLQRIVPLLASMHAGRDSRVPVLPSRLVDERLLRIHRWCHLAALALVAAGLTAEAPPVVQGGAAAGVAGAVAFAAFAFVVLKRTRSQIAAARVPASAPASQTTGAP